MTFLPFLLNRSRLPICSYKFFLFWPVPLKSVKKKSINACILINKISLKKQKKYLCMCINKQNQLKKKKKNIYKCIFMNKLSKKKKKYNFFLFWPVTLQTLNGSSTVLVSTYQVSPMTFPPFLLNLSMYL